MFSAIHFGNEGNKLVIQAYSCHQELKHQKSFKEKVHSCKFLKSLSNVNRNLYHFMESNVKEGITAPNTSHSSKHTMFKEIKETRPSVRSKIHPGKKDTPICFCMI